MPTAQFCCEISNSDPTVPLVLTIQVNDIPVETINPVPENYYFEHNFEDTVDPCTHTIEFELSGKLPEHTVVDDQNNIIKDAVVTIKNKQFESVAIDIPFDEQTKYHHNFNDSQHDIVDEFYGVMGCNGTAKFQFTTPIYVWLLENL